MSAYSDNKELKGDCVTTSTNGEIVFICMTSDPPSLEKFPHMCKMIYKETRYNYKRLIWSPYTHPDPNNFKWTPI